jgi:hypothetical protein
MTTKPSINFINNSWIIKYQDRLYPVITDGQGRYFTDLSKCEPPIDRDTVAPFQYLSCDAEHKAIKKLIANKKKSLKAKLRDKAMQSLGLTKVRGAVSGRIYWE